MRGYSYRNLIVLTHVAPQQLREEVYNIVAQIPRGRVLTYGDVARLSGYPNHSRLVGRLLSAVPSTLHLPCHRVVNASGRLAPHWPEQQERLEAEGVEVKCGKDNTAKVNLKEYHWKVLEAE